MISGSTAWPGTLDPTTLYCQCLRSILMFSSENTDMAGVTLRRLMCGVIEFEDQRGETIRADSPVLTALYERLIAQAGA